MTRIVLWVSAAAVAALVLVFAVGGGGMLAPAASGKNLKVYPKNTDLKVIKKDMKAIAKALGQECEYCHDLDAMDKDSKHKNAARQMMRMVTTINGKLKKDGFKAEVTCVTCHAGAKKPKK